VIAVTSASVAPLSANSLSLREFQNQAAERSGYLVATRSGVAVISSATVQVFIHCLEVTTFVSALCEEVAKTKWSVDLELVHYFWNLSNNCVWNVTFKFTDVHTFLLIG